jgi:isoleucyl-tRNA synthetase
MFWQGSESACRAGIACSIAPAAEFSLAVKSISDNNSAFQHLQTNMKDYKDTLNLPTTDFPMKANLATREPECMAHWESIQLYQKLREAGKGRPTFILHDGPPYANSAIHLGTALNKVLKDIVVKSKTLSGFNAPYVPGWDCHGLPIELIVEKKVGKAGQQLSHAEFRKACREYAASQVEIQKKDFKRLGVLGDWENPYLTMNFSYEADSVRALSKVISNGHFTRGEKPVHWCTSCSSALAEAEVEYKDKSSPSIYVAFDAVSPEKLAELFSVKTEKKIAVVIWTTTPWTLPSNRAVAANAKLDYALIEFQRDNGSHLILVAQELVSAVMQEFNVAEYCVRGLVKGDALEGLELQHPFLDRVVPIILGDHVTIDVGTGFVHTAPAHGEDDFYVGQRYGLVVDNPLDERSCFHAEIPLVGGLHVTKANEPIIVALADSGKLLHQKSIQHSFPHCWRHKTPLIFRATSQWFVSMEQKHLRELAVESADKVQWMPSWGKLRISNMLEGRPDWCVSRQRTWGNPIAIFAHKKTKELHPNTPELMERVAKLIEKTGIDAWYDCDAEELLGKDAEDYEKVTDILDVWFDSGVSHFCVLEKRPELHVPADLYLEGSDQHRGWFQTSLLSSLAIHNKAPFRSVLTHGYVVDGKGYKMSKSVGNVVAPNEVINKLGADVLRLWAASQDHSADVGYSEEIIKRSSDAYRRIRNTARFLLSNLNDFNVEKDQVADAELLVLDQWAILATEELQKKIIDAYDRYQFQLIYQLIHNFCSVEMGSFYLDIIKDRQYTGKTTGLPRRSGQTAMWHILEALVRWLAPILSFTAEEIWRYMPGVRSESVFLSTWYSDFPCISAKVDQDAFWRWMISVRAAVNKELEDLRQAGKIGSGLEAEVFLFADGNTYSKLAELGEELRFVLITSKVNVLPLSEKVETAKETEIEGLWVAVAKLEAEKCARCWQHVSDVGQNAEHPELCLRCVSNAFADGEVRKIA